MCQSEREKKLHQERFYGRKFEVIPKDEINIGGMDDLTCLTRKSQSRSFVFGCVDNRQILLNANGWKGPLSAAGSYFYLYGG